MDSPDSTPFVIFTVLTAPAILTNVSALMSLTTSNRIARAVDRSRELLTELSASETMAPDERAQKIHRVEVVRRRALLLVRALGVFQLAGASFAAATLVALVGTVLHALEPAWLKQVFHAVGLLCATVGVGSIITGATLIVRETRLAYELLRKDTAYLLETLRSPPATAQTILPHESRLD
jgi:hypothetical protein